MNARNLSIGKNARRSVSRVLYPLLGDDHSSRRNACASAQATNPDLWARRRACQMARRPYSVLLPAGLAMPALLPGQRCALTAPFSPLPQPKLWRYRLCGAFPRPHFFKCNRPGVTRHRISMEPGLSSAENRRGHPTVWQRKMWASNRLSSSLAANP